MDIINEMSDREEPIGDQGQVEKLRRDLIGTAWMAPTIVDCERYIMQELGELSSVLMRMGYQDREYMRSHDMSRLPAQMRCEIAQLYMMVLSLASLLGIDLSEVLQEELSRIRGRISGGNETCC